MSIWERAGTVTVTNGAITVTGASTDWIATVNAGDAFHGPDGRVYEIASVESVTKLFLATPYLGSTAAGASYAIQPTRAVTRQLVGEVQQLLTDFQDVRDNAGQGRFEAGSLGAPGLSFLTDLDTGLRRVAANRVALVGGGLDLLDLQDGSASGAAVQASVIDQTTGKLLRLNGTQGAFGLGGRNLPGLSDANALLGGGTGWYQAFDDTNMPTADAYVLLHMDRTESTDASQMCFDIVNNRVWSRAYTGGVWSVWRRLLSTEDFAQAATYTIANDAVATFVIEGGSGVYWIERNPGNPATTQSGLYHIDAGSASPVVTPLAANVGTGVTIAANGTVLTGTTGASAATTLSSDIAGNGYLENRAGAAHVFKISRLEGL